MSTRESMNAPAMNSTDSDTMPTRKELLTTLAMKKIDGATIAANFELTS
jgi:hypothetical protein